METAPPEQELLPKPQTDLPLPRLQVPEPSDGGQAEKEIPAHADGGSNSRFPIPKIALLIIVFVLIFVGIAGAHYFIKNNNNSVPIPSPAPVVYEPTPDPTADWETYDGDGFSFKYPPLFEIKSRGETVSTLSAQISNYTENETGNTYLKSSKSEIKVITKPVENLSLDKWFNQQHPPFYTLSSKPIKLDGHDGLRYIVGEHPCCYYGGIASITTNGVGVDININGEWNLFEDHDLDSLLSTFKFTEPALSCTPRPSCLDSVPACKMPITDDMCPPSPPPGN